MKLVFYSGRIKFDGDNLEKQGLGGSESALVNLTTTIKKINPSIEITVYNGETRISGESYNGISYKSIKDFYLDHVNFRADVFISLRSHEPFFLPYVNSKLKFLWSQDDMNEIGLQILSTSKYAIENLDGIFCISNHSLNDIRTRFPNTKLFLQRNGYRSDWIIDVQSDVRKPIAIYTSTPFRGLDVLVDVWPYIFDECKKYGVEPELRVYGDMSLYKTQDNFVQLYTYINNRIPNARHLGAIPQKELYKALSEAKVMLYPNHFLETGCMSVLEALACGVWCITTDLGALGEQVVNGKNGFIIPGDSRSTEYKNKFISFAVQSLVSDNLILDNNGLIFSWEEQANRFIKTIKDELS